MKCKQRYKSTMPLGLLVASATLLVSACSEKVSETETQVVRPVRTAIVSAAPNTINRIYPAVVLPAKQAELSFKVSGRVIELPIRASSPVKKGGPIAQLDKREYEAAVAQLESQLKQATAQLTGLKSGARREDLAALRAKVKSAKAQLQTQEAQVNRIRKLVEKGTIARVDLEKEVAKLSSDQADVDVAQQELKKAQVGARAEEVEAQEAVIQGLENQLSEARADLAETTLRAPFDGVIAARSIENFTNVQANTVIAILQNLETIDLQFDIPGIDVAKFGSNKNNIEAKARLDAAPGQDYDTELVEFGTQADAATQTFRGRLSILYPEGVTLLPGMTGSIRVTAKLGDPERLTVPESALAAEPDGGAFIWVVDNSTGSVSKRKVIASDIKNGNVSVGGDIAEGDVVVTAGVSFLREGMIVKPLSGATE